MACYSNSLSAWTSLWHLKVNSRKCYGDRVKLKYKLDGICLNQVKAHWDLHILVSRIFWKFWRRLTKELVWLNIGSWILPPFLHFTYSTSTQIHLKPKLQKKISTYCNPPRTGTSDQLQAKSSHQFTDLYEIQKN